MTENEFQKLVLEQFNKIDKRFDNLEKGQKYLQKSFDRLENNFIDFKEETGQNFEYTNSMVNQAFEKISEKMEQEEKVNTIFEFLKQGKNSKQKISKHKRESILA